jgi:hypothetical protein
LCWAKLECFDFSSPILICKVTCWALVDLLYHTQCYFRWRKTVK